MLSVAELKLHICCPSLFLSPRASLPSHVCRVIFDTLYLLMSFGHDSPEEAERLDPPLSYFRIRLICTLLETCGQFFNKGLAKKRLDRVLAYLQRYLLAKPPLPLDVEFDVQVCSGSHRKWVHCLRTFAENKHCNCTWFWQLCGDMPCHSFCPQMVTEQLMVICLQDLLAQLRPSLERLASYEEAAQAVAAIQTSESRSAAAGPGSLGAIEEEEEESDEEQDHSGSDDEQEGEQRISSLRTLPE